MQICAIIQNFPFFCNIMQKKCENSQICIYSANSAFFYFSNCRMLQNSVLSQKPNSALSMLKFLNPVSSAISKMINSALHWQKGQNSAISCKLMGFFYARFPFVSFIHKFLVISSILQIPHLHTPAHYTHYYALRWARTRVLARKKTASHIIFQGLKITWSTNFRAAKNNMVNEFCPRKNNMDQGFSQALVLPSAGQVIINGGGYIRLGWAPLYNACPPHQLLGKMPRLTL